MRVILFLFSFLSFFESAKANGTFTEMLFVVRNIELGLHEQFLLEGEPLPASLNEIELLNEIVERRPTAGILFNGIAVIPGAPIIESAPGIFNSHFGWRIFAISRAVNTDSESSMTSDGKRMPGRYSVWISPDGTYCSPGWIPETEVQAVLKQIGQFDPSSQPKAFPDAESQVRREMDRKSTRKRETKELHDKNIGKQTLAKGKGGSDGGDLDARVPTWLWWLAFPLIILFVAVCRLIFRNRNNGEGV